MPQETSEKFTAEEEEVVGFFMELIPILEEAAQDLEKKNLLDRRIFLTKKTLNFQAHICKLLKYYRTNGYSSL